MNLKKTSALVAMLSVFAAGFAYAGDGEGCDQARPEGGR